MSLSERFYDEPLCASRQQQLPIVLDIHLCPCSTPPSLLPLSLPLSILITCNVLSLHPLLHPLSSPSFLSPRIFLHPCSFSFSLGEGFLGFANILIAQYKPCKLFTVIRHIDLEVLSTEQLEEVQKEMKLSQLLSHSNIACYLSSFVVGTHLWAVQPLMHYGKCTIL